MDSAAIHGIHIAIRSRQLQTRLGEIFAAVATIRSRFQDGAWMAYRSMDYPTMGNRLQVSILVASPRRNAS